ncbi:MAG: DUF2490 domain-containing protein [Cyclobacteriaceae bacterium]|nr:DUF2490 domain-containing protein [Cyclobacteriaceae bacterium]
MYTKHTLSDFFGSSTKWAWEMDIVYRRQALGDNEEFWSEPLRFSFRPWIGYQYSKYTRITLNPFGMFYSAPRVPRTQDFTSGSEREYRITLQYYTDQWAEGINFTHRYRLESRWRDIDQQNGPTSFNWRLRYRIRVRTPLNGKSFYDNNVIYNSSYSEMHVEFGRDHGNNIFAQNRSFTGFGIRVWDWARFELGYLHQFNIRGNTRDLDLTRGPMFYIFFDYMSRLQLGR